MSELVWSFYALCMVLTLLGLSISGHLAPDGNWILWCYRMRCCTGLKPIMSGLRMHVVSRPWLHITNCNDVSACWSFMLFMLIWALVSKSGPTSCMGVLSNGRTAVTQNHITTSFHVQSKAQQASGYNTFTSSFFRTFWSPFLQLFFLCKYFFHVTTLLFWVFVEPLDHSWVSKTWLLLSKAHWSAHQQTQPWCRAPRCPFLPVKCRQGRPSVSCPRDWWLPAQPPAGPRAASSPRGSWKRWKLPLTTAAASILHERGPKVKLTFMLMI